MFETCLIESTTHQLRTNIRWYFLGTMLIYALTLFVVIVGSTMLISPQLREYVISATLILPPPPRPLGSNAVKSQSPPGRRIEGLIITTSQFIPPTNVSPQLPTPDMPSVGEPSDMNLGLGSSGLPGPSGGGSGWPDGVAGSLGVDSAAPRPPRHEVKEAEPDQPPPPVTPRRVSGGVLQGNAIRRAQPTYPQIARTARVAGPVEVEVVIDESGHVISANIVEGHPLLRQAALEAAAQWKFRPTLLSGVPIKVTGILVFNFRL